MNQLAVVGEVPDMPEVLFREGVSDRAPLAVSLSSSPPTKHDNDISEHTEGRLHPSEVCEIPGDRFGDRRFRLALAVARPGLQYQNGEGGC